MDRIIVYPGQIPLETDLLYAQRSAMVALGKALEAAFGSDTVFDGLTVIPTVPASLAVQVLPGSLYAFVSLEATSYGTLAADVTRTIIKQGVLLDTTELTLTPPATSGHAITYLIQAAFQEVDDTPVVLPYYNSSDPSQPYSGPENSGNTNNTFRRQNAVVSAKAGISATAGTQVAPAPDVGCIPLYTVVVANGATQLTSSEIAIDPIAPLIATKLPDVPHETQSGRWTYAADTGVADAMVVTLSPKPASYLNGMALRVKAVASNTGPATINVNGLGAKAIVRRDGTALQSGDILANEIIHIAYNGTSFQLVSWGGGGNTTINLTGDPGYYGIDEGITNALAVTFSPAVTAYGSGGLRVRCKVANTNSGPATINANGLGVKSITRPNGSPLQAGDMPAGAIVTLDYDGTKFQLVAPISAGFGALSTIAPMMKVLHTRGGNVAPAAMANDAWTKRILNTININQITGSALASGTITLPAGTYRCNFAAMAHDAGYHRVKLRDITNSVDLAIGTVADSHGSTNNSTNLTNVSVGTGYFVLAGATQIEMWHYKGAVGVATLGDDSPLGPLETHMDAYVEFIKEA